MNIKVNIELFYISSTKLPKRIMHYINDAKDDTEPKLRNSLTGFNK